MTKIVVVVGFLVAFAAGFVVGGQSRHPAAVQTTRPAHHGGWLVAELNLSPQQQEQMKQIWSETAWRGGGDREERRRKLAEARDRAIAALIRPEDKGRYDQILKDYAEQVAAMDREWRGSFQAAVERTKQILSPEQRTKYEELLQRHQRERGPRERRHGEREGGPKADRAATSRSGALR
ncbi:MAG TPA: periplasmic heavy metal sensor [Phycisphaerae bacterium]|nr:periplasmic heavy metal sensor [Phycisphaerae bacterium]